MPGEETKLVKQALEFLTLKYPKGMFWRNNVGIMTKKTTTWTHVNCPTIPNTKKVRVIRFGFPGSSDIQGVLPGGRFLAAEAKTKTGRLSKAQATYIDLVNMTGGVAFVFRSLDELENSVREAMEEMTHD